MTTRFDSFKRAVDRLAEALEAPASVIARDAAIQRFEFCVELAWRSIRERARPEGFLCRSPKECLRAAFQCGWIADEDAWVRMLEDRNRTSHTYDEELAERVHANLAGYLPALRALIVALDDRDG